MSRTRPLLSIGPTQNTLFGSNGLASREGSKLQRHRAEAWESRPDQSDHQQQSYHQSVGDIQMAGIVPVRPQFITWVGPRWGIGGATRGKWFNTGARIGYFMCELAPMCHTYSSCSAITQKLTNSLSSRKGGMEIR